MFDLELVKFSLLFSNNAFIVISLSFHLFCQFCSQQELLVQLLTHWLTPLAALIIFDRVLPPDISHNRLFNFVENSFFRSCHHFNKLQVSRLIWRNWYLITRRVNQGVFIRSGFFIIIHPELAQMVSFLRFHCSVCCWDELVAVDLRAGSFFGGESGIVVLGEPSARY